MAKLTDEDRAKLAAQREKIRVAVLAGDAAEVARIAEDEAHVELAKRELVERAVAMAKGSTAARMAGLLFELRHLALRLDVAAARRKALADRIAALEARPELSYEGTHAAGKAYRRNHAVTHRGSLWICRAETTTADPGSSADWQLACKRGADGRDAP